MSSFDRSKYLALLPFCYTALTRLKRPVDLVYLVATSWIPVLLILWAEHPGNITTVAAGFAFGYLAFISIYEIGYLANDLWDSGRSDVGRKRLGFNPGAVWRMQFVAIRIAVWAMVAAYSGWIHSGLFVAGYAALVFAIVLHNWLNDPGLRGASFSQLAVLRFMLPAIAMLDANGLLQTLLAALLFYLPLRLLSYLDGKGVLHLPQRRRPGFSAAYLGLSAPMPLFVAWATGWWVLVAVGLWFLLVFAVYGIGYRPDQNGQKL